MRFVNRSAIEGEIAPHNGSTEIRSYYSCYFLLPFCNILCNLQYISSAETSPLSPLLFDIETEDIQLCSAPPFYRSYIGIFILLFGLSSRLVITPPLAPGHCFQTLIFFALLGCHWRTYSIDSGRDRLVIRGLRFWCLGLPEWWWQTFDVTGVRFLCRLRFLNCSWLWWCCWAFYGRKACIITAI